MYLGFATFTLICFGFSFPPGRSLAKELESESDGHHGAQLSKLLMPMHRSKRIRNNFDSDLNQEPGIDGSLSGCNSNRRSSPHQNLIIRSSASIENGANYLNAHNGKTKDQCFDLCCQNNQCDTAIYEDKNEHRCYLFDCHGQCKFKEHASYVVWNIEHSVQSRPKPPKEEEELADLPTDQQGSSSSAASTDPDSDNSDSTRSREGFKHNDRLIKENIGNTEDRHDSDASSDDQDKAKTGSVFVAPHTVALSAYCASDISCEDPNAVCHNRACQCKQQYYNRNGLCRQVCPSSSHFECVGLGTSGRGPECIPKAQLCDSYMQCADGSDEQQCSSNHQDEQPNHLSGNSRPDKNKQLPSVDGGDSADAHDVSGSKGDNSKTETDSKVSLTDKPSSLPNKTPITSLSKSNKTNNDNDGGSTIKDAKSDQPANKHNKLLTILTSTRKPHSSLVGRGGKLFVSQEKLIIASTTSEAEGPIIALSLGLAFTLILVGLLVCRLRNVKHRLRKGRPLSSNEADYLINGMYL